MKQSKIFTIITFSIMMLLSFNVNAQKFPDLDKSPMDAASFPTSYKDANKMIKIVYSRPQLKGRDLATLAPNGEVWRTGANEAAELTLYAEMSLGKTIIKPGTYTFYLIPGDKEWTAVISTDLNVWGSYFYNDKNDVARLSVPVTNVKDSIEAFAITFADGKEGKSDLEMHLGWGTKRVVVPFKK